MKIISLFLLYPIKICGGVMPDDRGAFNKGFSASSYNENPYDENSEEFDQFERGRTQAIKRDPQSGSFFSGWEFDDNDENSVCGSKELRKPQSKINDYARAKGKE
jgi:hypothetical protein